MDWGDGQWAGGVAERFAALVIAGPHRADAERAVALAGGRVVVAGDWERCAEAVMRLRPDTVLLLDLRGVDGDGLAQPLADVAAAAAVQDSAVVAVLDAAQIDLVAATLLGGGAQLLVDPEEARVTAALMLAARRPADMLCEVNEGEAERLRVLNEEVARIAAVLAKLSARDPGDRPASGGDVFDRRATFTPPPAVVTPVRPHAVRQVIRHRRLRDAMFRPGLFEDPAWDILLDLYAAELEGAQVSVSSLCIAAAVAPTTALRWIGKMTDWGLLLRTPDPFDRRRAFMTLSAESGAAMQRYFGSIAETPPRS